MLAAGVGQRALRGAVMCGCLLEGDCSRPIVALGMTHPEHQPAGTQRLHQDGASQRPVMSVVLMVGSAGGVGSGVTGGDVDSPGAVVVGMVRDAAGEPPPHPVSTTFMVTSTPITAGRTW